MVTDPLSLEFTKHDVVSDSTFIHQTEDGTIFYRNGTSLWVHNDDEKIEVTLDGGFNYSIMTTHGNALYYGSNWKRLICKAELKSSGHIQMEFVADMLEDENFHPSGMASRATDDKLYVHRICDDPYADALRVSVSAYDLRTYELVGKCGNTALFRQLTFEPRPAVLKKLGDNGIVLVCFRGRTRRFLEKLSNVRDMCAYNAPWGSPTIVTPAGYVYMSNGEHLFTIDPDEFTMLPPLKFLDVTHFYIAGIHEGVLVGRGKCCKTSKFHRMTAQLPLEYVKPERTDAVPQPVPGLYRSKFFTEFTVMHVCGQGGFGRVFKVINKYDKTEYAVKRLAVLPGNLDKALNEVCKMAALDHPGIVRYNHTWVEEPPNEWQNRMDTNWLKIESSFENEVFMYIQMKLYNSSLDKWLKESQNASTRPRPLIRQWFTEIVAATRYLHDRNIIHCDLKPANILFDENYVVKLCDLGIATERSIEEGEEITTTRDGVGSSLYMSPEQSSVITRYNSKTDIFALGLIYAEMFIVMTNEERKIFHSYRCGTPNNEIFNDEDTANFVRWMANSNSASRPTCNEILNSISFETMI